MIDFFWDPDLRLLNCLKLIEIFFPVSFTKRRYGLQKKSSKNIENFWSKKFFENFSKNIFWENRKFLRFFILQNLRNFWFFQKYFFEKFSKNFFDQKFSIFFDVFFWKPYLRIEKNTGKKISFNFKQFRGRKSASTKNILFFCTEYC